MSPTTVSTEKWHAFLCNFPPRMHRAVANFRAGQLKQYVSAWQVFTSDTRLLQHIRGYQIEFDQLPYQPVLPPSLDFALSEQEGLDREMLNLIQSGVVEPCEHTPGEIISNIFPRPKPDGSFRIILNLRPLNKFVTTYKHFKMDTLQAALNLITPQCYMASIDWKHAYYSVPVAPTSRKYLAFMWRQQLYRFTCLPNGLSCAPRVFTKITKPLFSYLRKQGHMSAVYIDDSFLVGDSLSDCRENVMATAETSMSAGFAVHPQKSVLEPTQVIVFVGFLINSMLMTVSLPETKAHKLRNAALVLLDTENPCIQQVAELLGIMVASFPAVVYGPLYYRQLDNEKSASLRAARGDYAHRMTLSPTARADVRWWVDNILRTSNPIRRPGPDIILQSDSSCSAWGGIRGEERTGGNWSIEESGLHINTLELFAAQLTVMSLCKDDQGKHVQIQTDNTTAVAYINKMGGEEGNL